METTCQFILQSEVDNVKYELLIHKDYSQVQSETEIKEWDDELFINFNRRELIAIRDMINQMLDEKKE